MALIQILERSCYSENSVYYLPETGQYEEPMREEGEHTALALEPLEETEIEE